MALPYTDTFTGAADGTNLTSYSANWTVLCGTFLLRSDGTVQTNNSLDCLAYLSSETFNADHKADGTIAIVGSPSGDGKGIGVAVRVGASGGYALEVSMATAWLAKIDNSQNWTELGNQALTVAANDVITLKASGTTITPERNGTTLSGIGAKTDSTYSGGKPGLSGYGSYVSTNYHALTQVVLDNLGGGAATSSVPLRAGQRVYTSLLTW